MKLNVYCMVIRETAPRASQADYVRALVRVQWTARSDAGVLATLYAPEWLKKAEGFECAAAFVGATKGSVAYLTNLYVPRRRRRFGLGTALMRRVLREAAARGCRRVLLMPERGSEARLIPFYERLGFREVCRFESGETLMGRHLRAPRGAT